VPPTSPWTLLGEIPRTNLVYLALAVGYAGLAWRPGRTLSLLEELQIRWPNWRHHGRGRWSLGQMGRSGPGVVDKEDLRRIGEAANDEHASRR
jgi:hypothetical protein